MNGCVSLALALHREAAGWTHREWRHSGKLEEDFI